MKLQSLASHAVPEKHGRKSCQELFMGEYDYARPVLFIQRGLQPLGPPA